MSLSLVGIRFFSTRAVLFSPAKHFQVNAPKVPSSTFDVVKAQQLYWSKEIGEKRALKALSDRYDNKFKELEDKMAKQSWDIKLLFEQVGK